MRNLNTITLFLLIVGGLNWLLVGLFDFDLVAFIFHDNLRIIARVIYVVVGISALWQLAELFKGRKAVA